MDERRLTKFGTTIHITALDGIVNVNSLFTLAVFIGLAWNPNDPNNSLIEDPKCVAGPNIGENLIAFHVYSFSSFLFSSLIALGLKQAIRIAKNSSEAHWHLFTFDLAHINKSLLRVGYLVSAVGSLCGCGFLMMALVNVAQIKLGTLACGSSHTYGQDEDAVPSSSCCLQVKKIGQNPRCLCAVMLSNTAKSSGVKPEVAGTIPKRCNLADRPVGYKCGAYTLP